MPPRPDGKISPSSPPPHAEGWDLPTLVHEVATPLQVALGLVDGREDGLGPGQCRQLARSLSLIRDLLGSASGSAPCGVPVSPWNHLEGVIQGLRSSHPGRVIGLVGDDASRRGHRFDRLALAQTASNWVLNALRHAPGSEVRVRLRLVPGRAELRLEVEDDGEGMGRAERRRAFERGWRAEPSARRNPDGKGLGLAIVRRLVDAAGGTFRVGASASGGCRFTLRLPARPTDTRARPSPTMPAMGAKVAVIDDDATSRAVAVVGLRAEGVDAETLRPGRGLARRILKGRWEALLVDRNLGGLDGARLAGRLRSQGWPGGIVLWTGDARPAPPDIDHRLPKPASRREMVDAVTAAVAAAQDRRAAREALAKELAEGARRIVAAAKDPGHLGPLAHRLAGALGLAGYPAVARRAQEVERACGRGSGTGPWRKLIGDLRALAKRAGWRDAEDQGPARHRHPRVDRPRAALERRGRQ